MHDHDGQHSAYSDPGRHREALRAVRPTIEAVSAVSRNLVEHYRASAHALPAETRSDIDARWVERALDLDAERHGTPLDQPRDPRSRLQGCCRDHALLAVAILREHGVPARTRVGFAGYFVDGWHHDHVIAEVWTDGRWRRFDPEVGEPVLGVDDPHDMVWDRPGARGFVSASAAWLAHRRDGLDLSRHGVDPELPDLAGAGFCFDEVIHEVAHLCGDELLLWDAWGRMLEPGSAPGETDARWLDEIAELVAAVDQGDSGAAQRLRARYRDDDGLYPGQVVTRHSPFGDPPVRVRLR